MILRKGSVMVHGIRLPRFSSTFLCNWGIYMKIRLFPKSLAVYVLPEVTILPLGMTITSIITDSEMKYRGKIVSKLMGFKFPGKLSDNFKHFCSVSASSIEKWQTHTKRKGKGTMVNKLNFAI